MARDDPGRWVPGTSANPGGRPGVPDVIKATLRKLSPRAVKRLGELLDSADERIQLGRRRNLDRHLGRPAIRQTSVSTWCRGRPPPLCSKPLAAVPGTDRAGGCGGRD